MADESASKHLLIKIVNVLVFLFFFSSNVYGSFEPAFGHKTTYITPAHHTFYIWTIIDLLLLGLVIFQFFPAGTEAVGDVIGWKFAIVGILNGITGYTLAGGHPIVAFIFALLTAVTISSAYYDLKTKSAPSSTSAPTANLIFVHLPFSLWHAYSIAILVLSIFTAFGRDASGSHGAGVGTKVSAVIAVAWLAATSIGYALHSAKGDVAGAIVIAWFLEGIFQNSHVDVIRWAALAAFIISLLAIVKVVVFLFREPKVDNIVAAEDDERAPLIGH
ncbi:hypothetical protein BT69DRAFT_898253 [Atractiella rhizophila]|jgi:hypothetical protein|nr:hypothetical protein BT69DRAFT_898253 [Atractiella rhizophila]